MAEFGIGESGVIVIGFFERIAAGAAISLGIALSGVTAQAQENATPSVTTDYGLTQVLTGDLDAMVQRRLIRVLTTYSRTSFFMDGPQPRGITYEALTEFQKDINATLKTDPALPIRVVAIPVARDRLFSALAEGYGDIAAANLTITDARSELADFSDPFAANVKELLVTGPAAPAMAKVEDLSGKQVHVRRSSSYWESVTALNATLVQQGLPPAELVPVDENLEDEDVLELVSAGVLPFAIVDGHKATFWSSVLPDLTVRDDIAVREGGKIAWALRKDTPKLMALVNAFVLKSKKGTAFGNVLVKRYFATNKWVRNPGASDDYQRLLTAIDYLKRYADEYDFDWLMIAAQAYQESRIDQDMRSPAGAMGVMQLLPTTAADKNVGIADISSMESNIHAGVKYLRFMTDRYFDDPAINRENRALFAFASYNAGPAKIARLRATAKERGLDPNVWFNNVENIAAEVIGRETVTYVSNIAKYHYAYRMILAARQGKEAAKDALLAPQPTTP